MEIILHVGLHKTGTTFLQEVFFKKLPVTLSVKPQILPIIEEGINIVSSEFYSGFPQKINCEDLRFKNAEILKRLYPDAKIILGVRELNSWLRSLYNQYVYRGGSKPFESYKSSINHDYWDNATYIEYLKSLFKKVFVYNYEALLENSETVLKEMCVFIGVPFPKYENRKKNVSFKPYQIKVLRCLNFFVWNEEHKGIIPVKLERLILQEIKP